jgi:hypothetical protein
MPQEPKTIATFLTAEEAHMASNVLQDAGIVSYLEDANISGALGLSGSLMCEVNLQVAEADRQRAIAVLAQAKAAPQGEPATARRCPKCGAEFSPGFDVCWSCGSPMDNGT